MEIAATTMGRTKLVNRLVLAIWIPLDEEDDNESES